MEQAEEHAYRSESLDNNLCIPATNLLRALISGAAGTLVGGKGKKTYAKVLAAGLFIEQPELDLGVKNFILFSTPVVIKATGGRVLRHRARLNEWAAEGTLNYDEKAIPIEALKKIFLDTGAMIGLMDFRPEKKGPFGRFTVEFLG